MTSRSTFLQTITSKAHFKELETSSSLAAIEPDVRSQESRSLRINSILATINLCSLAFFLLANALRDGVFIEAKPRNPMASSQLHTKPTIVWSSQKSLKVSTHNSSASTSNNWSATKESFCNPMMIVAALEKP
ncbi:hypothetical protein OGAPHI_006954 [Ogataea philodendri]|uniref:Uncharacterized protein n=1 Tax=Ogataea philodendri TaxID=1378263 RepID=A0A9P8NU25_9ASCO|nr:uncharacterized protein OGAPHI_006954 [Ogataea philodendri]KAH3660368.1 hypothetical protein OGAPHI_006954 [Ogataea philodendri]